MPTVRVLPQNIFIEAADGQTIMEADWESDLYWPTTCGGQGISTTCACTVAEGGEHLDTMGRTERKTLTEERGAAAVARGDLRLACQARVHGDVTVTKAGVRTA